MFFTNCNSTFKSVLGNNDVLVSINVVGFSLKYYAEDYKPVYTCAVSFATIASMAQLFLILTDITAKDLRLLPGTITYVDGSIHVDAKYSGVNNGNKTNAAKSEINQ